MRPSAEQQFWSKVDITPTCWLWTGPTKGKGYAGFKGKYGHIYAWELVHAKVPQGLELDHLCRVRLCVNPRHLEAVTGQENRRRGTGHGSETHCPQGHPYDLINTYRPESGGRQCRICRKRRNLESYYRRKSGSMPT